MYEHINEYEAIVDGLWQQSRQIIPLKKRAQFLDRPAKIQALCSYKQLKVRRDRHRIWF